MPQPPGPPPGLPPGGPPLPPGGPLEDEPEAPARPGWRTLHKRPEPGPGGRRKGKAPAHAPAPTPPPPPPPPAIEAPRPELPSWAQWKPNPNVHPVVRGPPPSQAVVQAPPRQGLFGRCSSQTSFTSLVADISNITGPVTPPPS